MNRTLDRILTIFFAALFFIHVGLLLLGFASIPQYYERVNAGTVQTYAVGSQVLASSEMVAQSAAKRGFTLQQYAIEQILFGSILTLFFLAIASLVAWGARWNWYAWYSAFIIVFIAGYAQSAVIYAAGLVPMAVSQLSGLAWALIFLYFFLFPNGKPVPRWALWLFLLLSGLHFIFQALSAYGTLVDPNIFTSLEFILPIFETVIPIEIILIFFCHVYRYFWVSTNVEKQQTKWFLLGLVFFLGVSFILPADSPIADEVNVLVFGFVPLAVGVAILRYRLFDIDIIIRRTLTYAIVAAGLALVYFGSVILFQQIIVGFTNPQSDLITVLSTLIIAILFVPLRNHVQDMIDRRFNRKKYNAQQVLQKFGETVRDETDLEKLTGELINVVHETMQPKSVSVWLTRGDRESAPRALK